MDRLHEKVLEIEALENADYKIVLTKAYYKLDNDLRAGSIIIVDFC